MSRPTQAHLDRRIKKNLPLEAKQQTLSQMEYYMGAKLIEVGIDPQSVDIDRFQSVLKETLAQMGLEIKSLNKLLS